MNNWKKSWIWIELFKCFSGIRKIQPFKMETNKNSRIIYEVSSSSTELCNRYGLQVCGDIKDLILGVAGHSLRVVKLLSLLSLVMTSLTLLFLSAICNNNYKYYFICVFEKHWPEQQLLYSILETNIGLWASVHQPREKLRKKGIFSDAMDWIFTFSKNS